MRGCTSGNGTFAGALKNPAWGCCADKACVAKINLLKDGLPSEAEAQQRRVLDDNGALLKLLPAPDEPPLSFCGRDLLAYLDMLCTLGLAPVLERAIARIRAPAGSFDKQRRSRGAFSR